MQNSPYYHRDILTRIHNLNLKKHTTLSISVIENILVILYSLIGDYKTAYNTQFEYLKNILPEYEFKSPSAMALPNICLLKLLELLAENKTISVAHSFLKNLFPIDILEDLERLITDQSYIKKYFNIPTCKSCTACNISNICYSQELSDIYSMLEKRISEFDFSQVGLQSLISLRNKP